MDEFQNSLFLRGWLRDPFNFLGRVFLNKWPCCCSCRKVKIYTLIHYPSPSCHLPPPPHIWYFTLSVFPFYVLCKFSFGLRVTARKTIKQRRGKFKPGAPSQQQPGNVWCLLYYKWTEHNNTENVGTWDGGKNQPSPLGSTSSQLIRKLTYSFLRNTEQQHFNKDRWWMGQEEPDTYTSTLGGVSLVITVWPCWYVGSKMCCYLRQGPSASVQPSGKLCSDGPLWLPALLSTLNTLYIRYPEPSSPSLSLSLSLSSHSSSDDDFAVR